jgi:hypothetical protein
VKRERERAEKEAELDEKEAEYIRQVNTMEIDEDQFRELVAELDIEGAMGESVAEGPATTQATTQDEEVGKSEWDESVGEEEPETAAVVVESSTIGKGKQKVAPIRAKVFSEVDGPVSDSAEVIVNMPLIHHAHSATGDSPGRQSHRVSPCHTSGAARSARWIRVGAPGGGRVARSLRVRWLSPASSPGGSWSLRQMSRQPGMR